MPNARSDYYTANIFPRERDFIIFVEGNIFSYNPRAQKVKLEKFNKDFTPYYMIAKGDTIIGVVCKSPLIMLTAPSAIMSYSLRTLELLQKRRGGLFGFYEVRQIGRRDRFAASTIWGGGGVIFDSALRITGRPAIPKGTRNFGIDPSGRLLFAPNVFSGVMSILDIKTNKLLPQTRFVGKGARSLNEAPGGKLILGNSCGLIEIDTNKFLADIK